MIFLLIGFLIIIYSLFDFKKGFSLYLAYKLLLVTNITLISIPGVPLLTLEMAMTIVFILIFFFKGNKYQYAHMHFPFFIPFIFYSIALIISSIISIAGFLSEISNLIKLISENILLVWMIWQIIETKEDFKFLFGCITIVILGSCVYGLIEFSIQSNPLSKYESTLNNDPNKTIDFSYGIDGRGYRINSIFEHAIGAGMNWAIYAVMIFILIQKRSYSIKKMLIPLITAILCIPCIFLTKMRSSILFFGISLFAVINFKAKRFYLIAALMFFGVIAFLPFVSEDIINVVLGIFDSEKAQIVGGSNIEMRVDQFLAAFALLKISPIFGLGPSFTDVLQNDLVSRLLGSESIWLGAISQLGLFGVIAYIVQIFYSLFVIPRKYKSWKIFFVSLAYWTTASITSTPGFSMVLYYLFLFYFIKTSNVYQQSVKQGNVYGLFLKRGLIYYNVIKKENNII